MSWLRRLLQPTQKPSEIASNSAASAQRPSMPTVRFDPSTVTESVKKSLRRNIESYDGLGKRHAPKVYKIMLRSLLESRDMPWLIQALTGIDGISRDWAIGISRSVLHRVMAQIDQERKISLGITHAIWLYAGAPCLKNPSNPTEAEVRQDAAHSEANGKKYELKRGLLVDGKWTWPGVERDCKCNSRSIIPGLEK